MSIKHYIFAILLLSTLSTGLCYAVTSDQAELLNPEYSLEIDKELSSDPDNGDFIAHVSNFVFCEFTEHSPSNIINSAQAEQINRYHAIRAPPFS